MIAPGPEAVAKRTRGVVRLAGLAILLIVCVVTLDVALGEGGRVSVRSLASAVVGTALALGVLLMVARWSIQAAAVAAAGLGVALVELALSVAAVTGLSPFFALPIDLVTCVMLAALASSADRVRFALVATAGGAAALALAWEGAAIALAALAPIR